MSQNGPRFTGIGQRVEEARHERGLTRKELATAIGATLWMVEEIEDGKTDPTRLLPAIAKATDRQEVWLVGGARIGALQPDGPTPSVKNSSEETSRRAFGMAGRNGLLGSIAVLVVIRFFTEVFGFLPGAGNFIDIPLLGLLAVMAALQSRAKPSKTRGISPFALPASAFFAIAAASALMNSSRVEPAPTLVFLYGFLAPIAFYYVAYHLWSPGESFALSRLLVGLGVLEFAVVVFVDLPRFAAERNPDVISGTFGNNAYQLVFFLIMFAALVAGIATFEQDRLTARLAPLLLGGTFLVIFLAQYRALLVTTAVSVIAVALLLGVVRGRGFVAGVFAIVALALALSYVASHFPTTKFGPTVVALRENPMVFIDARLAPFGPLLQLYSDRPEFIPIGTGPGTYSSRAWRTFADVGDPASAEGAEQPYASALMGGRAYHTDVSDKYVLPRIRNTQALLGSKVATAPFSSYTSLLAEVGLLGFTSMLIIYVLGFAHATRLALSTMRRARPGDSLPALALAGAISFLVLLQMGFLDNWLEVARVTVPTWILLGVVTKEVHARPADGVQ
jgi:DNA-binding XRE family transcriptional regulator